MNKTNLSKIRIQLWVALLQIFDREDFEEQLLELPEKIAASWHPELYLGAEITADEVRGALIAQLGGDLSLLDVASIAENAPTNASSAVDSSGSASVDGGNDVPAATPMTPNQLLLACAAQLKQLRVDKPEFLTINAAACARCEHNMVWVTNLCRGCKARSCQEACKFGAISMQDGKAYIHQEKCTKCTKCIKACSYDAIIKRLAPCVAVCPVGAISRRDDKPPVYNYKRCIHCGKCDAACHFGAISERSQLMAILYQLKKCHRKVIAVLAPSIVGQLPGNIRQIAMGLIQLGFYKVAEVAVGADETTIREAGEWVERVAKGGDNFMTTSCCTAYTQLVKRHLPQISHYVSTTLTPMAYIAHKMRLRYPDALIVFVGPCVAKRVECYENRDVDAVMEFEELTALFLANNIVTDQLPEYQFEDDSSHEGREYGLTGGVARAVSHILEKLQSETQKTEQDSLEEETDQAAGISINQVQLCCINGLDRDNVRKLKEFAAKGCSEGNLVEVMACAGGCVGGPHAAKPSQEVVKTVHSYAAEGIANGELKEFREILMQEQN